MSPRDPCAWPECGRIASAWLGPAEVQPGYRHLLVDELGMCPRHWAAARRRARRGLQPLPPMMGETGEQFVDRVRRGAP